MLQLIWCLLNARFIFRLFGFLWKPKGIQQISSYAMQHSSFKAFWISLKTKRYQQCLNHSGLFEECELLKLLASFHKTIFMHAHIVVYSFPQVNLHCSCDMIKSFFLEWGTASRSPSRSRWVVKRITFCT